MSFPLRAIRLHQPLDLFVRADLEQVSPDVAEVAPQAHGILHLLGSKVGCRLSLPVPKVKGKQGTTALIFCSVPVRLDLSSMGTKDVFQPFVELLGERKKLPGLPELLAEVNAFHGNSPACLSTN